MIQEWTAQNTDKRAYTIIQKAVNVAQQTLNKSSGKERKDFAIKLTKELCEAASITMTDGQISTLIESAVHELRIAEGAYDK